MHAMNSYDATILRVGISIIIWEEYQGGEYRAPISKRQGAVGPPVAGVDDGSGRRVTESVMN